MLIEKLKFIFAFAETTTISVVYHNVREESNAPQHSSQKDY